MLKGNGFLLDPHTFTIYVGKTSYVLPPNEGKILLTLLMNYPRTVSKEELFHALWGTDKFIDENTKSQRLARLNEKNREASLKSNQKCTGKTFEILVESYEEKDNQIILAGRARNNKIVHFNGEKNCVGQFVNVKITGASTWHLKGELI